MLIQTFFTDYFFVVLLIYLFECFAIYFPLFLCFFVVLLDYVVCVIMASPLPLGLHHLSAVISLTQCIAPCGAGGSLLVSAAAVAASLPLLVILVHQFLAELFLSQLSLQEL